MVSRPCSKVSALAVLIAALATSGCHEDSCELRVDCPVLDVTEVNPQPDPEPQPEPDPATEPDSPSVHFGLPACNHGFDAKDDCGIFASSSLGSDETGKGSRRLPVATLGRAIKLAAEGGTRTVYACGDAFHEAIVVPPGFVLAGGLDCAGGWGPGGLATQVVGEAGEIPLIVQAGERTRIHRFAMYAAAATLPGGSSIATLVHEDADVTFVSSHFVASTGAPGLHGDEIEPPAVIPPGADGLPGDDACTFASAKGGAPTVTACSDGYTTFGGEGGDGGLLLAMSGLPGAPVVNPGSSDGLGGVGESPGGGCEIGTDGADGISGEDGLGATGKGYMTPTGYVGRDGQDGTNGKPGQGGGGGGGTRGSALLCGGKPLGGAGGGSGGAGGCAGRGGRGGRHGGASFGVLMGDASVFFEGGFILTGGGGDGGDGSPLRSGGSGGSSGLGGQASGGATKGCDGGHGGSGGNGGAGGGGLGGPSAAIARAGHKAKLETANLSTFIGPAGKGGSSGVAYLPSAAGDDGDCTDILFLTSP